MNGFNQRSANRTLHPHFCARFKPVSRAVKREETCHAFSQYTSVQRRSEYKRDVQTIELYTDRNRSRNLLIRNWHINSIEERGELKQRRTCHVVSAVSNIELDRVSNIESELSSCYFKLHWNTVKYFLLLPFFFSRLYVNEPQLKQVPYTTRQHWKNKKGKRTKTKKKKERKTIKEENKTHAIAFTISSISKAKSINSRPFDGEVKFKKKVSAGFELEWARTADLSRVRLRRIRREL